MRGGRQLAVLSSLVAGCVTAARPVGLPPLEGEGEVHLVAQPLPPDAARLGFRIASISAVRSDGSEVPLHLVRPSVSRTDLPKPRVVAWGRLEAGGYAGFSLGIERATLTREGAASDLLVPPEPLRVEAPFTVSRRHAIVMRLELRPSPSNEQAVVFAPELGAAVAHPPLAQQSGFCSSAGLHEIAMFDKRAHALTAVMPTGRDPWGLALDPLRSQVYVAVSGEDDVLVLDGASREEVGRVHLQPGDAPRELALTPDGRVLLSANSGSNSVSFIDPASMLEVARVQAGEAPTAVLMDRTGARAYVSNARSTFISIVDVARRAVAGAVGTDYAPLRAQLSRDGSRLYAVSPQSSHVSVISLATLAPTGRVYVGLGTTAIKVDPSTDLLYVAQGGVRRLAIFDPFSLLPVDYVELPGDATYMAIADAENTLFALLPERQSVAAVELASKRLVSEIDVGPAPRVLAVGGERN